jgi:hypothetical protein
MWWVSRMARFVSEMEAISELQAREDWLVNAPWRMENESFALCVDADLQVGENLRPVTIKYPPTFPFAPPSITPRGTTERWSPHQYGEGGELCLEHRPDNWISHVTGAEMLQSVYRLLSSEDGTATGGTPIVVPSAHLHTLGQSLRNKTYRFVVTASMIELAAHHAKVLPAEFYMSFTEKSLAVGLTRILDLEGSEWKNPELPNGVTCFSLHKGFIAQFKEGAGSATLEAAIKEGAKAIRALFVDENVFPFDDSETIVILVDSKIKVFRLYVDNVVLECGVILPNPANRLLDLNARLNAKKVGIIGAGSLGSKVAISLARAGVKKFLLLDDDVLAPENILRHALDWRSVGHHKARALAESLTLLEPGVEVDARPFRLGGQDSSGGLAARLKALADCDMIIDATGNANAFNYAASVASDNSKPMAWARVFGGGYGGLIARSRPGIEPSPLMARSVIEAWCSNPQFPPAPQDVKDYQAVGDDDQPMVADDADVSAIAAHFTRLIIDTLIAPEVSSFDSSVFMIGLRKEWIFKSAFDTYPIDLGLPDGPQAQSEITEEQRTAARDALVNMLTQTGSAS